ncbi:MtrB/PioB family decaheme-associated outer membrane protein [Caenimonas terrae]|uniref:MtrB/PioB family decaheme-associated outer membrane protein n=1 Tax=Caenimonas terrae TaxID=696074 RepID=A0ABW0NGI1_9BURK
MTASCTFPAARLPLLTLALLAAYPSARAEDGPVVDASASIGIGVIDGDRQDRLLYDQYSGLRPGAGVIGLAGADYYRRDDERGTSLQFEAADLLTGNRELGLRWKRPGDWKLSLNYGELTRRAPFTVNSGLAGAGSTAPGVVALPQGPGSGSDFDLKTTRTALGVAYSKVLSRDWQLDASVKSEDKEGSRLFGVGMACPSVIAPGCGVTTGVQAGSGVLLLPEPIDSNHTQVEGRLSYASGQLRLSAGYYGSFYRNANGSLTPAVPGALFNPVGSLFPLAPGLQSILGQPVALPPDNQAHQLDLAGSYSFTRTTLLNFKLAYSQASQTASFAAMGLGGAPAGRSDLGGKLATTLAQAGLTARPLPRLSLTGNVRYEHRSDTTPIALYNIEGTSLFTNRQLPLTRFSGKLQGSYQFSGDWRGTLAVDAESIDRGEFTASSAIAGVTALRQKTDETGVRAELRRRMSQDLSGAISVESRRRDGSNWLRDNSGLGLTEVPDPSAPGAGLANGIFSPTLADRRRDKVRLHADWQPNEKLAFQLAAEGGRDSYQTPSAYGLRSSSMNQLSVDWTYVVSTAWSFNGYLSSGRQQLDQARPGAALLAYDNRTTTLGLGFTGKPAARWEVGGSLAFIEDRNAYNQTLDATADAGSAALLAATGGLPDITFRQTAVRLFGKYTLDKQRSLRIDVVHQRSFSSDWSWGYNGVPFTYSDGTTVNARQSQSVSFIGVTYTHRWP